MPGKMLGKIIGRVFQGAAAVPQLVWPAAPRTGPARCQLGRRCCRCCRYRGILFIAVVCHSCYTCKRPTRVIYIYIYIYKYKYKNTKSKNTKLPEFTKYELWNLYIIEN